MCWYACVCTTCKVKPHWFAPLTRFTKRGGIYAEAAIGFLALFTERLVNRDPRTFARVKRGETAELKFFFASGSLVRCREFAPSTLSTKAYREIERSTSFQKGIAVQFLPQSTGD
jgi:L-fucose isomerase-like protein